MCLGHGRAGHLPDYSFMRYRYLPAWGNYEEIIKNNPEDYMHARISGATPFDYTAAWQKATGFSTPERCRSYIDRLEKKLEDIKDLTEED